jgi:hypothetical protein
MRKEAHGIGIGAERSNDKKAGKLGGEKANIMKIKRCMAQVSWLTVKGKKWEEVKGINTNSSAMPRVMRIFFPFFLRVLRI